MTAVADAPASAVGAVLSPYNEEANGESFDPMAYLASFDARLLASAEGRRVLTRADPVLFALVYLNHHLRGKETAGAITFSDAHLDWYRMARTWMREVDEPRAWRHAFIAPRATGKSTMWFTILPMWAAAHGWVRFAAAFADSASQAQGHLATFRAELDSNGLLQRDFPALCRPYAGRGGSDTQHLIRQDNGFIFGAKGIDAGALGMKVGDQRPDLLILDDVEPGESVYSEHQAKKRLSTIQNVVLPLNEYARVSIVGTVTMPGSLIHQLSRAAKGQEPESWITEERIVPHHVMPIVDNGDGTRRSVWPAKWSLPFLESIERTRTFQLNYANDPRAREGVYWQEGDFRYPADDGERQAALRGAARTVLSIDPAVTTTAKSDRTGIAVVAFSPRGTDGLPVCIVRHAEGIVVQPAEPLRQHVLRLLNRFPEITDVVVETNQGGEVWRGILHSLPARLGTVHQSAAKATRAAQALSRYQGGRVLHERPLEALEDQLIAFDGSGRGRDDILDAVVTAVLGFLADRRPRAVSAIAV